MYTLLVKPEYVTNAVVTILVGLLTTALFTASTLIYTRLRLKCKCASSFKNYRKHKKSLDLSLKRLSVSSTDGVTVTPLDPSDFIQVLSKRCMVLPITFNDRKRLYYLETYLSQYDSLLKEFPSKISSKNVEIEPLLSLLEHMKSLLNIIYFYIHLRSIWNPFKVKCLYCKAINNLHFIEEYLDTKVQ